MERKYLNLFCFVLFSFCFLICSSKRNDHIFTFDTPSNEVDSGLVENEVCLKDGNKYEATWESLDSRPLPNWYDEAKIGIFVHWGVFSVPAFESEWFWAFWNNGDHNIRDFMAKYYPPSFSYQDFGPELKGEFFNATEWAKMIERSGAKYTVFNSKHHDGYTLWPSDYSYSWNSMDVGLKRDILGEMCRALSETSVKFGIYHSLYEWFHPLYEQDRINKYKTQEFVKHKTMPELYELVNKYNPEIIWSDGDWEASDEYWTSKEFLAWLYNSSPVNTTVVANDRWGKGIPCHHGGYFTCADRFNPGTLQKHKWENAMTLDKASWGYRRNAKLSDYLTPEELIATLVETVSCGGNLLVNVGPTKEGTFPPIMEERLVQMGDWLSVNGEAIYGSKPYSVQKDVLNENVWYTQKKDENKVYGLILSWPDSVDGTLIIGSLGGKNIENIEILGYSRDLEWVKKESGISIKMPLRNLVKSNWAWTLVISIKY